VENQSKKLLLQNYVYKLSKELSGNSKLLVTKSFASPASSVLKYRHPSLSKQFSKRGLDLPVAVTPAVVD